MRREGTWWLCLAGWLWLSAGWAAETASAPRAALQPQPQPQPQRIVSLDYCADQYVLRFAERSRILAVSPDATRDFSYERDRAKGVRTVRPRAEDVVLLGADLVVRSYGGGPNVTRLLDSAGIPVLNIGFSNTLKDVIRTVTQVAAALGNDQEGQAVVTQMQTRLTQLAAGPSQPEALYLTPTGVTTGPGSLVHELLLAAGLRNYSERSGWHPLPLEQLAYRQPDLIAAAFFDTQSNHQGAWSPSRHPVAQRQLKALPVVALQGAWTACGGWFLMDAIEALAAGGRRSAAEP